MSVKNLYTNLDKTFQNLNVDTINTLNFGTITNVIDTFGTIFDTSSNNFNIEFIKFGNIVYGHITPFTITPQTGSSTILVDYEFPEKFKPIINGYTGSLIAQEEVSGNTILCVVYYSLNSNKFIIVPSTSTGNFANGIQYNFLLGCFFRYYTAP